MPSSVLPAVATAVLPAFLSTQFEEVREFLCDINEYPDGHSQRRALVTNSRRKWRARATLPAVDAIALRTFYLARRGTLEPFFFYFGRETDPAFTHDPLGVSIFGRYKVKFDSPWSEELILGRKPVSVELVEAG